MQSENVLAQRSFMKMCDCRLRKTTNNNTHKMKQLIDNFVYWYV